MVTFSSPSGNIDCWLNDEPDLAHVRCDIHSRTWATPRNRPIDCTGDYGNTLSIGPRRGIFTCASDAIGPSPTLPYGKAIQVGSNRCLSSTGGMRCVNLDTGHGFFVSRETVRLY